MSRRQKAVKISIPILAEILTTGWVGYQDGYVTVCTTGLPEGAKMVRSFADQRSGCAVLIFEHPDFGEVLEGAEIEYLEPVFTRMRLSTLDEVCVHGCHNDEVYGFVAMAGCPEHD